MGFSRQEYWSGLPFSSPGDLPNPGIEPRSPTLQAEALTSDTREAIKLWVNGYMYTQTHTHTHGGSLVAQLVKNPPASAGDVRDVGSVPGSGRSPEEGNGNPLRSSCLENPTDRGAWQTRVHRVTKTQARLSALSFFIMLRNNNSYLFVIYHCRLNAHTHFPGGPSKEPACQCRRRERRGFDPWVGKIPWRREWQPTPVFLPGESHGQRRLAGYSPWGLKGLDLTEVT